MWRFFLVVLCAVSIGGTSMAQERHSPDEARQATSAYLDRLAAERLDARKAQVAALSTAADVAARQSAVRRKILSLIGGLPSKGPLKARITGTHVQAGIRIENVVYESLPGFRVTANVYVPNGRGPFPAVVISPGHSPRGKEGDYAFAINFSRAGILALSYDIAGEGERWQNYDPVKNVSLLERPTGEHSLMAYQTLLMGEHLSRYFLNDIVRGIDYLTTRRDVDANRIGAYGCSGGGTMTAFAAALEPRIKVTASACFVTTMDALLKTVGPQDGEQSIPGFTGAGLDLPDWVELTAPKPYAIVSTTEDMFPFSGAEEAYREAKRIWGLFGAEDKLHWITGPGPHGALAPISSKIVAFFSEYLQEKKSEYPFDSARPMSGRDLWVTESGQLSTSSGSLTVQSIIKNKAQRIAAPTATAASPAALATLQKRLETDIPLTTYALARRAAVPLAAVLEKKSVPEGTVARLRFRQIDGPDFYALLATPVGAAKGRILYMDRSPAEALTAEGGRLRRWMQEGWQVLALDPAGGGGEEIKAAVLGDYALMSLRALLVDRTITGLRIEQIAAAAAWWDAKPVPGALVLYGVGASGPAVLHAAALDRRFTQIVVEGAQLSYRMSVDDPVSRNLPEIALPGVLLRYDLPDLALAVSPRPVWFVRPADAMGRTLRRDEFEAVMAAGLQSDAMLKTPGRIAFFSEAPEIPATWK